MQALLQVLVELRTHARVHKQQRHVVAGVRISHLECSFFDVLDHGDDHLTQHVVGVGGGIAVVEIPVQPPDVVVC